MISKHIFIGLTGAVLLAVCGKNDGEGPSAEAAVEVGFAHAGHFSAGCRGHFGEPPSVTRVRVRE